MCGCCRWRDWGDGRVSSDGSCREKWRERERRDSERVGSWNALHSNRLGARTHHLSLLLLPHTPPAFLCQNGRSVRRRVRLQKGHVFHQVEEEVPCCARWQGVDVHERGRNGARWIDHLHGRYVCPSFPLFCCPLCSHLCAFPLVGLVSHLLARHMLLDTDAPMPETLVASSPEAVHALGIALSASTRIRLAVWQIHSMSYGCGALGYHERPDVCAFPRPQRATLYCEDLTPLLLRFHMLQYSNVTAFLLHIAMIHAF